MFKWTNRKTPEPAPPPVTIADPSETFATSKVLPRFLAAISQRPAPVLLDLGPVVGANIAFFGDRLSCKIYVEDLFNEIEAHARSTTSVPLGTALVARLKQGAESIDGILCWDLFDFLDGKTAKTLAVKLISLLRKGGVLYGFFGTTPIEISKYTRYAVEAPDTFKQRSYPATSARRHVLLTRDLNRMFEGLHVSESVLLKSSTRETLFRKPGTG